MSFLGFNTHLNSKSSRDGTGKPVPEGGIRRYFCLLGLHFWKFVGLNLLFAVFSIPVITIPAALCGVNRVCVKLIREGNVFLWEEFFGEFKTSFKKSLLFGVLFSFLLFAGYYLMSLGLTNAALPLWSLGFWALGLMATATGLCCGAYTFVLIPMLELKNKELLKDAYSLLVVSPVRALSVAGVYFVFSFLTAILYPISLFLLVICLFTLTQYTVCFLVNTMAQEYIIGPHEVVVNERSVTEWR